MIKRFSPRNAARFRQNSLEELNEVAGALDEDVTQIVTEVDALEGVTPSLSFDNAKGVSVTLGVIVTAQQSSAQNQGE